MIKTFEQFINENYNDMPVLAYGEEYGAPLFNEVSESLMYNLNKSINEGRLVIDKNIIEEGLFDTVANLFKKGADKAGAVAADNESAAEEYFNALKTVIKDTPDDYVAAFDMAKFRKEAEQDAESFRKIEELCKSAEDILAKIAEKENEMYKTIKEKMTAVNEAIKEFTKNAIAKINEIVEVAKNKVTAAIAAVMVFCKSMMEYAKTTLKRIGEGVIIGFALPFVLSFIVYKGVLQICTKLVEKVKDGAKFVKDAFVKIKNAIANWVKDMLAKAKDALVKGCKAIKDGAMSAFKAIGNAYLGIVAIIGQLVSDAKDAISEAYNAFIEGMKEFADEVKAYVKEKWNAVTTWCKNTASAFADGVKTVWGKMKEKVIAAAGAAKDAYNAIKDYAKETVDNINKWQDDKQRGFYKAGMKYAVDKWGKDEVSSWLDEL